MHFDQRSKASYDSNPPTEHLSRRRRRAMMIKFNPAGTPFRPDSPLSRNVQIVVGMRPPLGWKSKKPRAVRSAAQESNASTTVMSKEKEEIT